MKIGIEGGGIAGLTTAIALKRTGIQTVLSAATHQRKTLKTTIKVILLIIVVAFYSCVDKDDIIIVDPNDPENPSEIVVGKVTEVGIPVGEAESFVIGPTGGSFTTSDKRLKIEVPEEAFSTNQSITIQPITNFNGPGKGLAYRLSPHNITFDKPIKLTFQYTEEDISTSFPEALGIAYQDEDKVWQGMGISQLDKTNKSVSVFTTHFSDWSLFTAFNLIPDISMVNTGETIELEMVGYFDDDLLVPMDPGQQAPIQEKRDVTEYVKEWSLAGAGELKANGAKATYTAPQVIPNVNPVAVTVELDLKQKDKFYLVRNIFIGRPGIYLKLDNNDYFHMDGSLRYLAPADMSMLTGGTIVDGQPRGLAIHWNGKISMQTFHWTSELPIFNYNYDGRYMYAHYYQQEIASGKLIITGYGEVDGYVTGSFYLDGAGLFDGQSPPGQNPWLRKGKIEGYFRVKRVQ